MQSLSTQRKGQKGNVLFLILIAVALFAALSYAVTQSSRSGGDAGRETNSVNTAALTQFANQMRTAVTRLTINGAAADTIYFNIPGTTTTAPIGYSNITDANVLRTLIFHPNGGAVPYQLVSQDVGGTGFAANWRFSLNFRVPDIGTSANAVGSNDLIAFAVGITAAACQSINQQLNDFAANAAIPAGNVTTANITDVRSATNVAAAVIPAAPTNSTELVATTSTLNGRSAGCFATTDATPNNIFYMVLAER